MKTIMVALLAMIGLTANASFIQENCSDSEGATKASIGHVKSEISITKRNYDQGQTFDEIIILPYTNFNIVFGDNVMLEETKTSSCKEGDVSGFGSYTKVFAKKITINRIDRSLFDKEIIGVNAERTTIERHLICRSFVSSQIMCQN